MRRLVLLVALLSGCAYYNGMYNAKRLARSAQRAEREGRSFEATSLWGQVAVKAESVVSRHPESKWTDDALLLRGQALQRMGNCGAAVAPLERVVGLSTDSTIVEEATFLLARCHDALGNGIAASSAYGRLTASADPARRREAWLQHARALRLEGRYDEALEALSQADHPRGDGERVAALAGLGRLEGAAPILDSLIARADTAAPWDSIFALAGRHDPLAASGWVARAVAMPTLAPEHRARWLLQDGRRLAEVAPDAAQARFAEAERAGPETRSGLEARLAALRVRLLLAEDEATLDSVARGLQELSEVGGPASLTAAELRRAAVRVRAVADSAVAAPSQGDLGLFFAAELARDSLGAPRLAAGLFRGVVEQWPASPYVPKALLAFARLDSAAADTVLPQIELLHPDSPYLAYLRGEDSPEYRRLEDSLRTYAATLQVVRPRPTPGRPTRPVTDDEPGSRRAEPK